MSETFKALWDEVFLDTLIDTAKLIPFLFVTYLFMEWLESRFSEKTEGFMRRSGFLGPVVGGFLGLVPQCGFSAAGASLYAARVITPGTLIAIFLSCSDEMIPIMISGKATGKMLLILALKAGIGIGVGLLVDLILRRRIKETTTGIEELCEREHCECEGGGIWLPAVKHTLSVTLFVLLFILIMNSAIFFIGEETLKNFIHQNSALSVVLCSLIGLIPSCASSVVITESYIGGLIPFGALLAGLLSGSGVGLLVLFRTDRKIKGDLAIAATVVAVGIAAGLICLLF